MKEILNNLNNLRIIQLLKKMQKYKNYKIINKQSSIGTKINNIRKHLNKMITLSIVKKRVMVYRIMINQFQLNFKKYLLI